MLTNSFFTGMMFGFVSFTVLVVSVSSIQSIVEEDKRNHVEEDKRNQSTLKSEQFTKCVDDVKKEIVDVIMSTSPPPSSHAGLGIYTIKADAIVECKNGRLTLEQRAEKYTKRNAVLKEEKIASLLRDANIYEERAKRAEHIAEKSRHLGVPQTIYTRHAADEARVIAIGALYEYNKAKNSSK